MCRVLKLAAVLFEMERIGPHGVIFIFAGVLQQFVKIGAEAFLVIGRGRHLSVLNIDEFAGGCDEFIDEALFVFTARGLGTD